MPVNEDGVFEPRRKTKHIAHDHRWATCSSKRTLPLASMWHWMPDSQTLAYVGPDGSADLWIQPVTGGPPRQLTHFPGDRRQIADFAWSADGKRLAVARASATNDIVIFRGFRGTADR